MSASFVCFALFALMFSYTAEWSVAAAFSLNAAAAAVAASFVAALAVITPPRVVITIRAAKKTESSFFAFFIAFHLLQELPSYYTK